MDAWVEREVGGCEFPDQRLKTRFGKLLSQLSKAIGAALPVACQDWAATRSRMAAAKGPILVLHDTTEFSFQRERPEEIGKTRKLPNCRIGQPSITKCGLLMHSSLAITATGNRWG